MKILMVNQPINNRGDEAAHRSFVRSLNARFPEAQITIAFLGVSEGSMNQMVVPSPSNRYISVQVQARSTPVAKWALRKGLAGLIARVHPTHRRMLELIRDADLVVCAPGGICMGGFQNWPHLHWLELARGLGKKVAYYSRSFGPFPDQTSLNRDFKRISIRLLKSFDFLSIRDRKTMGLADSLGLPYEKSIDSAFLDTPDANLSSELASKIGEGDYIVFVPNELTWHVDYRHLDKEYLDRLYLGIMTMIKQTMPNSRIVMLPQIYNGNPGDVAYFAKLKALSGDDSVVVLPDSIGSDIQQAIIAKSKMVIGARYHSVVFAINNAVPFVSLSYEHKMSGLLQILGKDAHQYDMEQLKTGMVDVAEAVAGIREAMGRAFPDPDAKQNARRIAIGCLDAFVDRYRA